MGERYLVLGTGQLGSELVGLLRGEREKGKDVAYTYHGSDPFGFGQQLDVTNFELLEDLIIKVSPDVIINAVAMTNVDACESDRARALKVNAEAVKHVARAVRVVGSYMIHVSTDYVFDGTKGLYREDEEPNPINYYGLTKLLGEAYALSYDDSLVVRTSGVFRDKGFPSFVVRQLRQGRAVKAYAGFYSPISARKLAEAILALAELRKTGIINVAGERVSRYQLAVEVAKAFGLDPSPVTEVKEVEGWVAKRPYDSSLDISRARALLNFDFYSLRENLRHAVV
ncbi:DTDP-4-dehydrorhamnose reductase [Acidilobus saccharovorans 345-15]|uniref:dTDP-4-dehydrorhamnose reductase n=1 Tax=Acidilobus saccharovorans (strain DSM 16705 / JCM 18335 / VKM B-2471 / 345-15) TaxID=666510 RepID=D9Q177_ACIS3|nr:SDR family oxidoreductase [Acidilobus saccharovorans]ADL19065.1 DTDP-4-dehydrorhamnose reductase [Acidilobus saccharovorans 345-15]